jgi:hypothetical protein
LAQKLFGPRSLLFATCLETLSKLQLDREQWQRAEKAAELCWQLRKPASALGELHQHTQQALAAFIASLDGQEKVEEATALLKYCLNSHRKAHPSENHPQIPALYQQLALHYWKLDQLEEVCFHDRCTCSWFFLGAWICR